MELKACPAECLHDAIRAQVAHVPNPLPHVFYRRQDIFGVMCGTCGCSTAYYRTEAEAVTAWNERKENEHE